jgi:hypothetical protein
MSEVIELVCGSLGLEREETAIISASPASFVWRSVERTAALQIGLTGRARGASAFRISYLSDKENDILSYFRAVSVSLPQTLGPICRLQLFGFGSLISVEF